MCVSTSTVRVGFSYSTAGEWLLSDAEILADNHAFIKGVRL
jgi:hypothetical protein